MKRKDMGVINVLKDVTRITKPFPFLYTLFLLMCWTLYLFLPEAIVEEIDNLVFVSLFVVLFLIRLSYPLKYCIWYRLQCALPLLPQGVVFVDTYIYEFSDYLAIVNIATAFLIFLLSLVNTYFVFIKPHSRR